MHRLGGEYAELARFPGDHEIVWDLMRDVWERVTAQTHARIEMMEGDAEDEDES